MYLVEPAILIDRKTRTNARSYRRASDHSIKLAVLHEADTVVERRGEPVAKDKRNFPRQASWRPPVAVQRHRRP